MIISATSKSEQFVATDSGIDLGQDADNMPKPSSPLISSAKNGKLIETSPIKLNQTQALERFTATIPTLEENDDEFDFEGSKLNGAGLVLMNENCDASVSHQVEHEIQGRSIGETAV